MAKTTPPKLSDMTLVVEIRVTEDYRHVLGTEIRVPANLLDLALIGKMVSDVIGPLRDRAIRELSDAWRASEEMAAEAAKAEQTA